MGPFDLQAAVRSLQERAKTLLSLDKTAAEIATTLRDTHRILSKLDGAVESLARSALALEKALEGVSSATFPRLEEALGNIERVTLGVEAVAHSVVEAIPKPLQQRLARRKPSPGV